MSRADKLRLSWSFAAVGVLLALDLWSKAAVFAFLDSGRAALEIDDHGHPRHVVFGEWFAFMKSLNPGMAWGFDRLPPHVLVFGRIAAVLFLIVLIVRSGRGRPVLNGALVLILAGALGNLHDNLLTEAEGRPFGMVRDFIDVYFPVWDWHFPTFNVADSCITVGAVLLFLASFAPAPESAGKEGEPRTASP